MTVTMALLVGYVIGWVSVMSGFLVSFWVFRPKEPEMIQSEPEPEPVQRTPEQMEADRQFQQWLNQMDDMLKYNGKGGVKDGNKD